MIADNFTKINFTEMICKFFFQQQKENLSDKEQNQFPYDPWHS